MTAHRAPKPRRPWLERLHTLGRALYLLAVQSLVGLVALVLFLYLAVNSPSAPGLVSRVLSEALPGDVTVGALHLGPSPGHVELRRVRIFAPDGRQVLAVRQLVADLRWYRLVDSIVNGTTELVLRFDAVSAHGVDVRLENDKLGRLLLPQAFSDPDEPYVEKPPGRQIRLSIADFQADDVSYLMDIPAIRIDAQQASLHGSFDLHTRQDESPEVSWSIRDVHVPFGEAQPAAMRDLPPTPPLTLQVARVDGSLERVHLSGIDAMLPAAEAWHELSMPDTAMLGAELTVDLGPEVKVEGENIRLATSTDSAFIGKLLGNKFAARALVDGGFRVDERGFRAEGDVVGDGLMAGFETQAVRGHTVVEAGPPGGPQVRVVATNLDARGYGGTVTSAAIEYRMLGEAHELPVHFVQGRFEIRDMAPGSVLTSEAVKMQGPVPLAMQGALSGEVGAAVRVRLDPATDPELDMDLALDLDLTLMRKGAAVPLSREVPYVRAHGAMLYGMGPARGPVIDLDDVLVHTSERPDARMAGHEWLRASGKLDMLAKDTNLRVSASIPHLAHLLAPLGVKGVDGAIELQETKVEGSLTSPKVAGNLRVSHLTAQGHEIRSLRTKLRMSGGSLLLQDLQADTDIAQVQADVEVHLLNKAGTPLAHRLLHVHKLRISKLDLGVTLPQFGVQQIAGQAGLARGEISMDLADIQRTLQLDGDVVGSKLVVYGETFPHASAHIGLHGKHASLKNAVVGLWNGRDVVASGDYHMDSQRFTASLDVPEVDLTTVHQITAQDMPVRGIVSAHIEAEGDRRGVMVHDTVLHLTQLGYGKIELGSADLHIDKSHDGPAVFSSERFFPHFKLLAGTEASFAGQKPQQVVLHLATDGKLDPFGLLGMERPAGMAVAIETDVTATLDLRAGQPLYRVVAKLEPYGLDVDLGSSLQRLRNATPLEITVNPSGVEIGSLFMDLGRHQVELCGQFAFADLDKATPATLLLYAAGTLDIPRVGPLAQSLATLDLRLDLLANPDVVADARSACLKSTASKGRLRVEGPLEALRIDGGLQTRAGHVALRRFGHDISIAAGGRVLIDATGQKMAIRVPTDHPIEGNFDDGKWSTWGQAEMLNGEPVTIDFHIDGRDVPWSSPKEYAVTVTPALRFVGTRLDDPKRREMALKGTVDVREGAYFKSFDRLGGLFGNVADRKVESFSKPIKETMPWLAEIELDIEVSSDNFEFTSQFPLLKFDVLAQFPRLLVQGPLFEPRIFDRVEVKAGSDSKMHYAINHLDFDVVRGALDFRGDPTKPYLDLVLTSNIPVRSANVGSRAQMGIGADLSPDTSTGDTVTITVTAAGVLGDPNFKLGFSSNQGDSEADVQYIIATGHRRSDASGAAPQIGINAILGGQSNSVLQSAKKQIGLEDVAVSFDYDPASSAMIAEVKKNVGRQITLAAKVLTGREENRYSATFAFRLSDQLSFNGLWRRQQLTVGGLAERPVDIYDFKLRYRMPIE